MQVNNCTQPKPSFGMALKIRPEAVPALKEASRAEIAKLESVGEQLKNTKFYNLEIGINKERTIVGPDELYRYKGGTYDLSKPKDETLDYKVKWVGENYEKRPYNSDVDGFILFENKKAARKAYKDITSSQGIDRDVKMIKYLDERAIEKENERIAAEKEKSAVAQMVENLFKKFGIKSY